MIEIITESNFIFYCYKHYANPQCFDDKEFVEDLSRIKYIKRLFNKYKETGELKERLILNHIVILNNVFGPIHTSRILLFKLKGFYPELKAFLEFLGYIPNKINNIEFADYDAVETNQYILEKLKTI